MKKVYLIIFIIALVFTGCQKTSGQDSNIDSAKICMNYPAGFDPENNNLWQVAIVRTDVAEKIGNLYFDTNATKSQKEHYEFYDVTYNSEDHNWIITYTGKNTEECGGTVFVVVINESGELITAYEGTVE